MAEVTQPVQSKASSLPPLKPIEGIVDQTPSIPSVQSTDASKATELPPLKPVESTPIVTTEAKIVPAPVAEASPKPTTAEVNITALPVDNSEKKVSIQDQITQQLGDSGKLTGFTIPQTETSKPKVEKKEEKKDIQISEPKMEPSPEDEEVIHTNGIQKLLFGISVLAFIITLLVVLTNM